MSQKDIAETYVKDFFAHVFLEEFIVSSLTFIHPKSFLFYNIGKCKLSCYMNQVHIFHYFESVFVIVYLTKP